MKCFAVVGLGCLMIQFWCWSGLQTVSTQIEWFIARLCYY